MPYRQKPSIKGGQTKAVPLSPQAAVQNLIRISQSLMVLAEKETQALLFKDLLAFSILQYEKEKIAGEYMSASKEFRTRLNEFRTVDKVLMSRLERLQKDLAEKATSNNALVEQMQTLATMNTQKNIRSMQEASFSRPVRFSKITSSSEGVQS
jgi:hypothetical protein